MVWQNVTLIGVGLLGGSLGLALGGVGVARGVLGYVRRQPGIAASLRGAAVGSATPHLHGAFTGTDLLVPRTPRSQTKLLAQQMCEPLAIHPIATALGSLQATVTRDLAPTIKNAVGHFVGSHPMAGSEK